MVKTTSVLILEKSEPERRFTLGVVYEPGVTDTQGDFAKAADIEAAAWEFMSRLQTLAKSGVALLSTALKAGDDGVSLDITDLGDLLEKGAGLDDEHLQIGDEEDLGMIVESYIAPIDLLIGAQTVKKGAWLLGVVWSPTMFAKIKSGARTGLSLYGRADTIEEPVSV